MFRPRPEVGSRVATQLLKLAICLCHVTGREEADLDIYRLIYRVAMDTSVGFNQEIVSALAQRRDGMTSPVMARKLCISETHLGRKLNDLLEVGIVEYDNIPNNSNRRGRPAKNWTITSQIATLWDQSTPTTTGRKRKRSHA